MPLLLIFLFVSGCKNKRRVVSGHFNHHSALFFGCSLWAWMEMIVLFILFTGKDKAVFVLCALPPLMLYLHSFLLSNKEWAIAFLFHEKGDYLWITGLEENALIVFFVCGA